MKKTVFGLSRKFFRKNIDFSQKKIDNNTLSNYYINIKKKIALREFSYVNDSMSLYVNVTEGTGVLKREVKVKEIEKRYDHPLAEIVQIASQYKSEILLEYDKYKINAKSIMGIIAFNPSEGMNVTIAAKGTDEGEAVEALEKFFICQ